MAREIYNPEQVREWIEAEGLKLLVLADNLKMVEVFSDKDLNKAAVEMMIERVITPINFYFQAAHRLTAAKEFSEAQKEVSEAPKNFKVNFTSANKKDLICWAEHDAETGSIRIYKNMADTDPLKIVQVSGEPEQKETKNGKRYNLLSAPNAEYWIFEGKGPKFYTIEKLK